MDTQSPESRTELDDAIRKWNEFFFGPIDETLPPVVIDGKKYYVHQTGSWKTATPLVRKNGQWVPIK